MITFLSLILCLPLLLALLCFLHKVWWTPIYFQYVLRSQGIKGPSYRFLHGTTKETITMRSKSTSSPMELSHAIVPRILPDIHFWTKQYGKNFLIWHGPEAQLVVNEPELIKEILNNKDGAYPKVEPQSHAKKLLGDGLVFAEGEKWTKLRKLANHAFYAESLKDMFPAMIASVEALLQRWRHEEGKVIDAYEEFKVLSSEVISRTAFGSSYLEGKNIFDMLLKMGAIISRNDFNIRIPGIGKLFKSSDDNESDMIEKSLRDSVIAIIKKRKEKVKAGEADSYGNDFIGLLIRANEDANEKKRISIDSVIDECKTFYIAGQETTSSLLTWIILLLSMHTEWQEKARKEVIELFGQENPNPDGIARLKTISMIINETLRLYSPVAAVIRKARSKVKLGKFVLPANVHLNIPILALHHNPEIWGEDAHLFKPERFSEGVAKATKNNTAVFLPFGLGPRFCVGLNFATNEVKIALSMILQKYKLSLSPNYVHAPIQVLIVRPQHGLKVVLHPL